MLAHPRAKMVISAKNHKEYDVPKDATVEIINKYGYVKVHAWDKRICSMDVNILANTTSKKKADDIFAAFPSTLPIQQII